MWGVAKSNKLNCVGCWIQQKCYCMPAGVLIEFYFMGGGGKKKVPPDSPPHLILEQPLLSSCSNVTIYTFDNQVHAG